MDKKTILVVTATYNPGNFILDCIESVKESITLDKFNIHHVIVDDASTDKTQEILNNIHDPQISVVLLKERHGGPSYGRNYVIEKFPSDYIFTLDQDDILTQNGLRYLFEYLEENKVEWVYSDFLRCNKNKSYRIGDDYYGWPFKSVNEVIVSMFTGNHFFQQNCMYKRSLFTEVGGYNKYKIYQDFDLYTRFLLNNHFPYYLNSATYFHRFHELNLSNEHLDNPELHKKDLKDLFKIYKRQLQQKLNDKEYNEIVTFVNTIH